MKAKYLYLTILVTWLLFEGSGIAAGVINVVNPSFELDLGGNQNATKRDLSEVLGWVEGLDNGSGVETMHTSGQIRPTLLRAPVTGL